VTFSPIRSAPPVDVTENPSLPSLLRPVSVLLTVVYSEFDTRYTTENNLFSLIALKVLEMRDGPDRRHPRSTAVARR
jgi:hypothetical protein